MTKSKRFCSGLGRRLVSHPLCMNTPAVYSQTRYTIINFNYSFLPGAFKVFTLMPGLIVVLMVILRIY